MRPNEAPPARRILLLGAAGAVVLAGFGGCTEYGYTERTAKDVFQQVRKNTVDVLMVVDNSCSMFEEQDNLAANFSGFIEAFEGVDVDWQIGVTTTDTADADQSGHLLGGDDEIELVDPEGRTIDRVAFDMDWNVPTGASLQLDPSAFTVAGNDDMANWCPATAAYGDGDLGSPGAVNAACGAAGPAAAATSNDTGSASDDTGSASDDTGSSSDDTGGGSTATDVRPGDVIITEFMADPAAVADALGEWVELSSTVDADLDLSGWQLVDSGRNRFVLPADSVLPAGGRMVLGRSADTATNGGLAVDVAVGAEFTLNNAILVLTTSTDGAEEIFSEMVAVGITGSGIEMGLDAARLALSEPLLSGHNAGLIREDANLSLIFVSDENDYSRDPVNDYYRHFAELKGAEAYRDHGVLNFSAVVGKDVPAYDGQPSCESSNGVAAYGLRYLDLATRTEGALESICDEDFAPIAAELGLTISGLELEFPLSEACNEETLVVTLYADQTDESLMGELVRGEDYSFVPARNAIRFEPSQVPPSEAYIVAEYDVLEAGSRRNLDTGTAQ